MKSNYKTNCRILGLNCETNLTRYSNPPGERVVRRARRQGRALRHGCRLGMKPYSARAADGRGPPSLAPPWGGGPSPPTLPGDGVSAQATSSGQVCLSPSL